VKIEFEKVVKYMIFGAIFVEFVSVNVTHPTHEEIQQVESGSG
jgi:hypothetical protein